MRTILSVLFVFSISPLSAHALPPVRKSMPNAKGNGSFELPAGWKAVAELYGLPWVILGPDHGSKDANLAEDDSARRTAIAFIPTGQEKVAIDPASAEKSQSALFASRKAEIEKANGAVLATIPYVHETWKGETPSKSIDVHRLGLRFRQGSQTLTEISYHVVCGNRLYMIKSMISEEDRAKEETLTAQIVRSFRCD